MRSTWPGAHPAAAARQRGQARMRAVTATVGAAGLVGAGVIAAALPGPAHGTTSAATGTGSSPAGTGSSRSGSSASSGGSGSQAGSGMSPAQGQSGQTTSGGS